jgi:hypothetical protein
MRGSDGFVAMYCLEWLFVMGDFVADFDALRLDTFFGFSCDGLNNFVDIILI